MTTNENEVASGAAVEALRSVLAAGPNWSAAHSLMTLPEAAEAYMTIRGLAIAGDDEGAHSLEDRLMRAAIEAVVDGHPDALNLARFAAMAGEITFRRSM